MTTSHDPIAHHLVVDAEPDTVFALFEALNRNLDMTAILPPIVCRYPFANDEISQFCDDIEFSPEDAGRSDPNFLYEVLAAAIESG